MESSELIFFRSIYFVVFLGYPPHYCLGTSFNREYAFPFWTRSIEKSIPKKPFREIASPSVIFFLRHVSFLQIRLQTLADCYVGFLFVLKQNPDSSVSYEQFKSNLVDVPTYMRHVVALRLAQQVRFP